MWLATVGEAKGEKVEVDWQPFSLAQINNDKEDKVWERPEVIDGSDNTLLAHRAGLAAKRQGKDAFEKFFITLLKARHEDKADLTDPAVMNDAATASGLDQARFREDIMDPDLVKEIGESHTKAVDEVGAFGVPTFVFPSGKSAFLKMFIPPADQAEEIHDTMFKAMSEFAHVGEFKRPQPPWPHDVI
jgi:predicted DsbA family dithiol-disulfide isomerase